ncbi:helix-turn-helix transcriptional regulator [Corynebacterium marquesiae]|uniref:helix-turn-helix domain-containing protein n=1 Tax=Corynebacterium marquesiae TaxID=2913503 RepID=UPI0025513371|nr:helix-turn-helix transcriptional regulator [Corynebacterium marquesiae]MDK8496828.1 helix-turn-helix transcriptional regulator [Corynebacterium marquesiae]
MNKFGKVIARLLNDERLHKGVTQAELAESTGISQSQISKQLRGTRDINIDELDAIVTALNMSLVELIRTAEQELNPDTRDDLATRRAGAPVSDSSASLPDDDDGIVREFDYSPDEYAADSSPNEQEEREKRGEDLID